MQEVVLGMIEKVSDTITTVSINNDTYCKISWALKIIAQIIEIVLGGILLATDIAPNLKNDFNLENPEDYEDAAIAYIVFFALEIILDIMLWTFVVLSGGHEGCAVVSVLLSVLFEMPIMICGLYLMRYKGTIDWDQQMFELIFQIWYIVNIMLQITVGFAEEVCYWGVFILGPLSYVIACLPYAFVIIPKSGWHWYKSISEYYDNSRDFIHGKFNSTHTQNMLDVLICLHEEIW
ncbi:hypothetical protein AC249_AIPGENE21481 [Exaiptasia diaphana]|nr:hypothetical protein AC249_AIPGENE21481 [Exaiptasia diaphana]